jgi:rare lipoprotein A
LRDRAPGTGNRAPARCRWTLAKLTGAAALAVLAAGCASTAHPARRAPHAVAHTAPAAAKLGAVEEGLASWYGEPYHGRPTASGSRYDMWAMTAAHRTLPFGTVVRVTNLDSQRQAEITINDRGPFVAGRILDLSRRAAEALGAIGPGVIPVRLEVRRLGDGMPDEPCWEVQVGAFARQENAQRARANLEARGLAVRFAPAGGGLTRVRATGLAGRHKALELAISLAAAYPGAVAVPCGGGW